MAQLSQLKAFARKQSGTGGARAVRREAKVPGVIYGGDSQPEYVAVHSNELVNVMNKGRFLSTLIELDFEGKTLRVIPREIQSDPVNSKLVHVDFQRVGPGASIRVDVPVRFVNDALSPGLKRGGVLNVVRHEIEVMAPADNIPEVFEFNLEGLEIGRSIHISAIELPEGVKPTIQNRDFTVATIAGHRVDEEAAATPGAAEGAAPAAEGAAPAAEGAPKAAAGAKAPAGKAPAGKEAAKPAAAKPAAKAGGGKK